MNEILTTLGATAAFALVAFAGLFLALALPKFFGRKTKRRCACAASREVMRLVAEREKAALDAKRYRPETVDLRDLPQISPDLADLTRGLASNSAPRPAAASGADSELSR